MTSIKNDHPFFLSSKPDYIQLYSEDASFPLFSKIGSELSEVPSIIEGNLPERIE